jgi:hypothetical protein
MAEAVVVGNPAACVVEAVERSLELASTWLAWDGSACVSDDGARIYTPHKVVRRMADHLIDHIAEVECLLSGQPTLPDAWHGSLVTVDADWARFTEVDLVEAGQRLRRLAQTMLLMYDAAGRAEWDRSRGDAWTLREIAEHVGSAWYAEQVGRLAAG